MDKNELGGKIFKGLSKAAETVKISAEVVAEIAKETELPKVTIPKVNISKIEMPKQLAGILDRKDTHKASVLKEGEYFSAISADNAVLIFYILMNADGVMSPEEEVQFNLLAEALMPAYSENRETIIEKCDQVIKKTQEADNKSEAMQSLLEAIVSGEQNIDFGIVGGKLLIWDMLTIAYADNNFSDEEKDLMAFIINSFGIKQEDFVEMVNCQETMLDLEREIEWLKDSDKPYRTIEDMIAEIRSRQDVIKMEIESLVLL